MPEAVRTTAVQLILLLGGMLGKLVRAVQKAAALVSVMAAAAAEPLERQAIAGIMAKRIEAAAAAAADTLKAVRFK